MTRRLALLAWAARQEAWILEDDYGCEFRFDGRPIAALQGLDSAGRVVDIGTFNKWAVPRSPGGVRHRAAGIGRHPAVENPARREVLQ
jgi:DNA-binding transcriptional MocR family regulator